MHGFFAVDGPASRRYFVLYSAFLGASRCPPQNVIRYTASTSAIMATTTSEPKCKVCGAPATVHLAFAKHQPGKPPEPPREEHYCVQHVPPEFASAIPK